ncbi:MULTISPECIES: PqiB family protein [Acidiphilium]|uniref:Paraquat-inducible protein B n=1 Tax=Acidiphilium rubrum TaxID=526 RepID=A0A8G2CIX9_ACIRU|nr:MULTISPECIES: MlaD family protein [Acidiphilium]SIQ38787.1 paraquat-inducible protein B [Acidiphilium rubrum]
MIDKPDKPEPPNARFRSTRWPGLIWAVPVAAAGIVIWLGLEAIAKRGPEVTVSFPTAGGIKAGSTTVKYRGVTVGHVEAVRLDKTLNTMKVSMQFTGEMQHHLGKGTRFWIAGRSVSFSNLASIKSVIAGPYIGIAPHPGPVADHFTGLTQAPVIESGDQGETIALTTAHPGNLSRGAAIYFNHFKIGKVLSLVMQRDGKEFVITAFIEQKRENLITSASRFWNAGGVSVSSNGNGPRLMLQSIPALVSGAIGVATPGGGHPIDNGTTFHLYGTASAARAAPGPHAVPYRIVLAGGPHGLARHAKVTLEGADAGVVTNIALGYDANAGALTTTVQLVLEPRDIPLDPPDRWNLANPAPQMNAMLSSLIGHGLRAHRVQSTPVIGTQTIALDIVKAAPKAVLSLAGVPGEPPTIPSTSATSIDQIMDQVSGILANVHDATSRIAAVSRSPRTRRTLERLDRTITHIDAITRTTDARLPQLLAALRRTTQAADASLRTARGLLAQHGTAANAPESESLPHALYELTRAAQSLRELTDYLSGHPNSIILGKGR